MSLLCSCSGYPYHSRKHPIWFRIGHEDLLDEDVSGKLLVISLFDCVVYYIKENLLENKCD
jgi:hypothetical protein